MGSCAVAYYATYGCLALDPRLSLVLSFEDEKRGEGRIGEGDKYKYD